MNSLNKEFVEIKQKKRKISIVKIERRIWVILKLQRSNFKCKRAQCGEACGPCLNFAKVNIFFSPCPEGEKD